MIRFLHPTITALGLLLSLTFSSALPAHLSPFSKSTNLCRAGFFRNSRGRCQMCPPGTYRPSSSNTNKCTKCAPGTFQPMFGASQAYLCRACYPGTFAPRAGARRCWSCPSNKSSGFGSRRCVRCKPGQHVSFRGARCRRCGWKSFSSTPNAHQCALCLDGKVNLAKTACEACKPGDTCFKCPTGMYRSGNECKSCPLGTSTSKKGIATKIEDCIKCRPGFFRGKFDRDCYKCPNGIADAPKAGAMACKNSDGECPLNHFISADGICVTCAPGQFKNPSSNQCEPCEAGSTSEGKTQTQCQVCPPGSSPNLDRSACTCGDGYHLEDGVCVACAAGTFRNDDQHVPNFGCEPCRPGWISKQAASKCTRCPYGSVSNEKATECNLCSKGKVPNVLGVIDLYYEYGQTRCIDGRTGKGQGSPPDSYH